MSLQPLLQPLHPLLVLTAQLKENIQYCVTILSKQLVYNFLVPANLCYTDTLKIVHEPIAHLPAPNMFCQYSYLAFTVILRNTGLLSTIYFNTVSNSVRNTGLLSVILQHCVKQCQEYRPAVSNTSTPCQTVSGIQACCQ